MVVEVDVGDGDPVGTVGNVEETVEIVLASGEITGKVAVVNPDVGGLVNADGITVSGLDTADLHVADDDVLDLANVQTDTSQGCK